VIIRVISEFGFVVIDKRNQFSVASELE